MNERDYKVLRNGFLQAMVLTFVLGVLVGLLIAALDFY